MGPSGLSGQRSSSLGSSLADQGATQSRPTRCERFEDAARIIDDDSGRGATDSAAVWPAMCQNVSVAERLGVTPRWGRHRDTRSPAASGNRRSDAHAFDETANSHNQSTSEVAHWYETSTLTALGPGGTPYDHVSAGLPLQVHSVTRSETGFRWDLLSGAFDQ